MYSSEIIWSFSLSFISNVLARIEHNKSAEKVYEICINRELLVTWISSFFVSQAFVKADITIFSSNYGVMLLSLSCIKNNAVSFAFEETL